MGRFQEIDGYDMLHAQLAKEGKLPKHCGQTMEYAGDGYYGCEVNGCKVRYTTNPEILRAHNRGLMD
ncbi:hypothetical protein [Streptomyces sp. CBMA152]|uniref:hypothetical protein n=1 Tax=Streptomyces sp. CBMA152 TaxID=1896312 RepID=UPI0016608B16|nr:hypothetical protein [Streptomyces sp. CBMA152]MBD0743558.1 hypothetical protein [Streptomyces sp. CBMA152]